MKVIVGLGITGLACLRFLRAHEDDATIIDTNPHPKHLLQLRTEFPDAKVILGQPFESTLDKADEIIISPGVPRKLPAIQQQIDHGKPVIGDIELFARQVKKPVIAITGSNAKTTVTTLVGLMLTALDYKVAVCGNIGTSVLSALSDAIEYYVIEISSFQLESTFSLKPIVATILNISPDHLNRYDSYQDYIQTKQRIYHGCQHAVINLNQPITHPANYKPSSITSFSVDNPKADFHIMQQEYLAHHQQRLFSTQEMVLNGHHHWQNALSALAIVHALGLPVQPTFDTIKKFHGCQHRCQWVRKYQGVDYYNDSKATNVGAAKVAIKTIGQTISGKVILIAGGQAKGASFTDLKCTVKHYVSNLIVMGEDQQLLATELANQTAIHRANSLQNAVTKAMSLAQSGDAVLLSPACASFDMFDNFKHRGDVFVSTVEQL